ncbi:MAG: PQQ-like beta-propeller repeat protein [Pirellulaceae bacterium]|nr:PQQ-like beta-propeller repeat protein [Pirellulaceae bacterium]
MVRMQWYLGTAALLVAGGLAGAVASGVLPLSVSHTTTDASITSGPPRPLSLSLAHTSADQESPTQDPSADAGWPCILGPEHGSISRETGLAWNWSEAGPPVVWRIPVGEGYAGPVAMGDDVVLFHRPSQAGAPLAELGHPHQEDDGPEEVVSCYSAAEGSLKWEFRRPTTYHCSTHYSSGPYSTPVIDGDRVFAWGTEGVLYCLDRGDGSLVWERPLSQEYAVEPDRYYPVGSSPLVLADRLILNVGGADCGAGIVALDKATGDTLWTATDHEASFATPTSATMHGREFVFVFTRQGLVALDPASGQVDWQIPFQANNPEFINSTSPIVAGNVVFTSAYSAGNLCVEVQPDGQPRELWRDQRRSLDSQYNPLVAVDRFVFGFAALDDTFRCLELTTGKVQWKGLRELDRGTVIAVDGHFLIVSTTGNLAAARLAAGQLHVACQTTSPSIAGPVFAFPALSGGKLYVKNEREMVCFDMRK